MGCPSAASTRSVSPVFPLLPARTSRCLHSRVRFSSLAVVSVSFCSLSEPCTRRLTHLCFVFDSGWQRPARSGAPSAEPATPCSTHRFSVLRHALDSIASLRLVESAYLDCVRFVTDSPTPMRMAAAWVVVVEASVSSLRYLFENRSHCLPPTCIFPLHC